MDYKNNDDFSINVGFDVNSEHVIRTIKKTNSLLSDLPSTLFKSIDFKTTSAMIGAIFCDTLAEYTNAMVNPIEKGHPDIIPKSGANASEEELRKYPEGLEIKCTIGNIEQGANLRAGVTRIDKLTGVTWQAHHREVGELMGLTWDFVSDGHSFNFPTITGAFYTSELIPDDWGAISGTTGRNTKVSGMKASGKEKMGAGWVNVIDKPSYINRYSSLFKIQNF
jgi:hypothetical protein